MTFETADDVLEHFGVRGMKWGVRKAPSAQSKSIQEARRAKKKGLSTNQKRAIVGSAVVGAAVVGAILAHRSGVSLNSVRSSVATARGARTVPKLFIDSGTLRAAGLPRTQAPRPTGRSGPSRIGGAIPMPAGAPRPTRPAFRSRVSPPSQSPAALRASIAESIRQGNAMLREQDNRLGIPYSQRTYITEWE